MSDFEAIETREQFEEAVKDRLEQERETVRREFSGYLSPEAVEEKYKEYLSPKDAEEKYKGYLSPEDAANKDAAIAKYEKEIEKGKSSNGKLNSIRTYREVVRGNRRRNEERCGSLF